MQSFLKRHRYPLILFFLTVLIFFANLRPGTYLSGWDSLQTELSPWLAVKRAFFSVWEEYQSLGLLAGMAHASDLVRALFIGFVSFIIPQVFVRYFFHNLMLFVGSLGGFYLLQDLLGKEKKQFAFLGALFYMLNLGTIQMFYVPYEPFSVFFAFLPWEIWIFLKLVGNTEAGIKKRELALFFFINLLATPQAYLQTLFVVYLLILGTITLGTFFGEKKFSSLKRGAFLIGLILIINSFWLLPQLYFLKTQDSVVTEAKINQLATEDVFYQNYEKGTLRNFLKLEGFYFDLHRSNNQYLFLEWREHFAKPFFSALMYLFAAVMFIGLFSKRKWHLSFLLLLLLIGIGLLNASPPFGWINQFLRQNNLINQIFRSPFTKFIIPFSLVTSYFFASGCLLLTKFFAEKLNFVMEKGINIVLYTTTALIFLYSLPAWQGLLFSPSVKVKIPNEYLQTMQFFKKQDRNKRIALLPDYTFWGWFFHRWGYNGSGFLWYGIEQPIISRTFDVWSDKSEGYFWEIKSAAEAENITAFENALEKYDVDYLLLDDSLLPVSSTLRGLQYDRLNAILAKSKKITLVKKFQNLSIYEVFHNKKIANFVSLSTTLHNIGPAVKVTSNDLAYGQNNTYQTRPDLTYTTYFPFLDFTSQTKIADKRWQISEDESNFIVSSTLEIDPKNYDLFVPSATQESALYKDQKVKNFSNQIRAQIDGKRLTIIMPKSLIDSVSLSNTKVENCSPQKGNIVTTISNDTFVNRATGGAIACFGYEVPFLEQRYGYLVKIKSSNVSGRHLFFYILDQTKKQAYIEDRLHNNTEYYLIAPKYQYGLGYNFTFHNDSYQNLVSENQLNGLSVYLFPTEQIQNIYFELKNSQNSTTNFYDNFRVSKKNYFTYEVHDLDPQASQIILWQSFNPGWIAYQNGKELKNHVLVDNWANGWELDKNVSITNDGLRNNPQSAIRNSKIVVIFWPQYLEFAGFGLAIISLFIVAAGVGGGGTRQRADGYLDSSTGGRKPPTGPAAT